MLPKYPAPFEDARLRSAPQDEGNSVRHQKHTSPRGARAAGVSKDAHRVSETHPSWRTSVRRPVTAAAAAIAGPIRCVLAFLPWRPSKLRFEVEAMRSPFSARSLFIDMQLEQPGSRHSKPASRKTRSSPSSSA